MLACMSLSLFFLVISIVAAMNGAPIQLYGITMIASAVFACLSRLLDDGNSNQHTHEHKHDHRHDHTHHHYGAGGGYNQPPSHWLPADPHLPQQLPPHVVEIPREYHIVERPVMIDRRQHAGEVYQGDLHDIRIRFGDEHRSLQLPARLPGRAYDQAAQLPPPSLNARALPRPAEKRGWFSRRK